MDLFWNGDQLPNFSEPWNFSDTVLVAEDKRFHVHKSILAISSPVFNTMFQSGFKEATSTEIPLPGKKAEKIYELLCMIYPFPMQISGETFTLGTGYNHGQKQSRHSPKKTSFITGVSFSISNFHISTLSPLFNVVTT